MNRGQDKTCGLCYKPAMSFKTCGFAGLIFFLSLQWSNATQTFPPVPPSERLVGIAYSTWHTSTRWKNVWGTPELGDYISDSRAVIRRHAQWLADAGVDFIWIDWSNDIDFVPQGRRVPGVFDMIEGSTTAIFDEYSRLPKHPKISIFVGVTGAPEAVYDGRLQRKADQIFRDYVNNPRYRPLLQDYLSKPLLVIYVNTPSPFQQGVPAWDDPRFTVRWMTGFVTEQDALRTSDLVSRFGYWSWEDRGPQTFSVFNGQPEAMTIVASWRGDGTRQSSGRREGKTFKGEWARAREIGPKFALVVSWNEWIRGEQPSPENSKDLEPSKQFGEFYLRLLKQEIAKFKSLRN